jgi:hypothetical protein
MFASILAACSTPYQEMGLMGGVSASQIDAMTIRFDARGNAFTDIGQIRGLCDPQGRRRNLGPWLRPVSGRRRV